MSFPEDQIAEVKQLCPDVQLHEEAGCAYLLLPGLNLPDGCSPASMDALLCPTSRDGYPSSPSFLLIFRQILNPFGVKALCKAKCYPNS